MMLKYVTVSANSITQVIADIIAVLGGASIASLSASCDKVNSTLVSNVASGWAVYDAAAGTNAQVVSCADVDGLTTKYLKIYATATPFYLDVTTYESWNAGTHAGTNATIASGSGIQCFASTINTFWVFATPRSLVILNSAGMVGNAEVTRDAGYLAGSTYPCSISIKETALANSLAGLASPRLKNPTATGDLTGAGANGVISTCVILGRYVTAAGGAPNVVLRDSADVSFIPVMPLWAGIVSATSVTNNRPVVMGRMYDLYEIPISLGNLFDTFSDGTDTYMLVYGVGVNCIVMKVA